MLDRREGCAPRITLFRPIAFGSCPYHVAHRHVFNAIPMRMPMTSGPVRAGTFTVVWAFMACPAWAQTPSVGQRQSPGADQGINTSDIGGGRTLDMLIDMAAAASAPPRVDLKTKPSTSSPTGDKARQDSREVLLQDLKRSESARAPGGSESSKADELPSSLAAPERLVEQVASPVVRDSRDQEQPIEVRTTTGDSAGPARTSSAPRSTVDEDSWIRSLVRYIRDNRGWIAATAASVLVVVGLMTLLFKRAAQTGSRMPSQARASAGGNAARPSTPTAAAAAVSPRPSRRHRSLRRR
jgi:hypothetical protein